MTLPFFPDANHSLRRESPECEGEFREVAEGRVRAGWELRVPEPGPDGVPYLYIFVGPTAEHRGTAIRIHMTGKAGELPGDARMTLETFYHTGSERTVVFEGTWEEVRAAGEAVGAQRRAEVGQDYVMRVGVDVPEGAMEPDPGAEASWFEIECVKLWWNETA